jgi:hypothetical protein
MNLLRFIILNFFAFLLIGIGIILIFIPIEIFFIVLKYILAVGCLVNAVSILIKWKKKKRIMEVLILRNLNEIRPDTFKKYRGELCWELVYLYIFYKLRKTEKYRILSEEEWKKRKEKVFGKTLINFL